MSETTRTLSATNLDVLRFNAKRDIDKCPLGEHDPYTVWCGKCGWSVALLSVLDHVEATAIAHAQAVQRLTEELQQSQAALAALRAQVVHPGYGNAWECVVCGETWVDAGAHPDKAHPNNGCLARPGSTPRPEGST